jgi:hypothetical protein
MGPYVPRRPRLWDPEDNLPPPRAAHRYSLEVAERMRARWNAGFCPCNCGNTIEYVRNAGFSHLIEGYEQTGDWTGPVANA